MYEENSNKKSLSFIGKHYRRGNRLRRLQVGDEVIIHPTRWGRSQATKSYPAKIVIEDYGHMEDGETRQLAVCGIRENKWIGARINQYAFNRLEFVKRNCSDEKAFKYEEHIEKMKQQQNNNYEKIY